MQDDLPFFRYRPLLYSIAYNMLGSAMDAEDAVQETYLRWRQASTQPDYQNENPRGFLTTVISRLCIDQLRSARARRETYVGVWLPEPLVQIGEEQVTGKVEMVETLSIAMLHLLEEVSPLERAAFLLRQVFDYDYTEIAAIVEQREDYCRQLVRRARQRLREGRPRFTSNREQQQTILSHFMKAVREGDMQGLLSLLHEDVVTYSDGGGRIQTAINPLYGKDRVSRYLFGVYRKTPQNVTYQVLLINGLPGLCFHLEGMIQAVLGFAIRDEKIIEVDFMMNPEKLRHLPRLEKAESFNVLW